MTMEPGRLLLHYRLTEKIGEGGMGVVWRARDTTLARDVAIKVLPEPLAQDAERLARFDREAKLLASLNHPGIATIHGFHRAEGVAFLAMELVEGSNLAERLARGALPLDEALDVLRQIAEALEAAHERGVVHRDLKPANVKLAPDGKVKVLDFGLAKALSPESVSGGVDPSLSPTLTSAGTVAGMILGTAAYMSPEQARGRPLDRRTDLWSFGCLMYECLTGRQLFGGETVSDSMAAILRKDPDWSSLPVRTPREVRRLLRRLLTRDPRKRLQDAGDARIELEQAIESPAAEEPPATAAARRSWIPWAVAAAAALTAVFFALDRAAPEPPVTRRLTIPLGGRTRLIGATWFGEDGASPPVVSPDGHLVVYGVTDAGSMRLWLRPLDDFETRPLAGSEGAEYAFWSPDSRNVGYFRGGKLKRVEVATGREQSIGGPSSSFPRGATWSARGQILFAPNSNSGLYLISADGGEPRPVTTLDPDVADASHRWPCFLPDGEHFLFTFWTNNLEARDAHAGIYVASIAGDEAPRRITPDASNALFAPPDRLLVVRGDNLVALPFDPRSRQVTGQGVIVASDLLRNASNGHSAFSVSAEGTLVYATGEAILTSTIAWYDRSGKATPTAVEPAPYTRVVLAPDGARAAAVSPGPTGDGEIWILDLVRGTRLRLVPGVMENDYPVWSRDGERILYATQESGAFDFFVRRADGSGSGEPVLASDGDKVLYDWSRDGKYLAYWPMGSGIGTSDIWIYSIESRTDAPLISGDPVYMGARFSPDGRWIAYVSDESGRREVFVQALGGENGTQAGARSQVSTAGGVFPHWRDDGRELLYVDPEQRVMTVSVEERDGRLELGTPQELFAIEGAIADLDASGDHRRLLLATVDRASSEPLRVVLDWQAEVAPRPVAAPSR